MQNINFRNEFARGDGRSLERKAFEDIQDKIIAAILFCCALISVFTTFGIVFIIFRETFEFFQEVSFAQFFLDTQWTPLFAEKHFGIWPLINGTLLTTTIAMLVAIPLGLSAAIYLSEYASPKVATILRPAVELLAGVPTVVYGYFALLFVTPVLRNFLPLEVFNALSAGLLTGIMKMQVVTRPFMSELETMYLITQIQLYSVKALEAMSQWCQRLSRWLNRRSLWSFVCLFLIGASLSIAIAACESSSAAKPDVNLKLVSYSVTKAAHDRIIPKFVEKWKKEHNQNVTFETSYSGSGSQTRAVIEGSQDADVVHLALALDIHKIEQAGLIESGWEREAPKASIVTRSVAAIVTRPGNPKNINTWTDLAKNDLKLVAANPKTSGIAIWKFLALWGSVTQTGGDEPQALEYVTKVYKNAPVLTKDAREASDLFFKQGQGDVLVNYENEVILAERDGQKLPYTIPSVNISIDNPVAIVDKNVDKHGTRDVAEAFIDFLFSEEAQQEFALLGYRPVNPSVGAEVAKNYPLIQTLFTVQDLGGWDAIQKKFFAKGATFDRIQAQVASKG